MAFTSRDSIASRITQKKHTPTNSGVYVLPCKKDSCDQVYVGQSQNIPKRLDDHIAAKHRLSMSHYASAQHDGRGHEIVPADSLIPYRSNSLSHRLIIETCILSVSNTVKGNKASSCNKDMTTIAPIILQASPVDWKIIAEAQPDLNPVVVPRKYRPFFSSRQRVRVHSASNVSTSDNAIGPLVSEVSIHTYNTRSKGRPPELVDLTADNT